MNESSASCLSVDALAPLATAEVSPEELDGHGRLHFTTFQHLWRTHFHVLEDAPMLPRPVDVSVQVVRNALYRNDCRYSQFENYRYFCYTLSGVGGFNDKSGTYALPAGHAFLVEKDNADAAYFYPPEESEPWRFLALNFNGLPAHAMTRALVKKYGPVYALAPDTPIIKRLLAYEANGHSITNIHVADGAQMVMELLLALMAAGRAREETDPVIELVRRAIPMMSTGEDVLVQDVARALGVSREHLSRCFQRHVGMSPRQFCLEQRMRRACLLLKDTNAPIKTIAAQLGYTEYSNFVHAFRQVTHMTPTEFRQRGFLPFTH
ncbi:MAG: AraC family transcriptional regulator [Capsulimonas sp.]|uniref:AraC family transcriptional regulator n=1 Tax=Capsulimonas sp. TaxID=2494211 RepID=UPI003266E5E2